MDDDERLRIVKGQILDHVCSPSQRHIRDGWAIHMLAEKIVEKLDHRTGIWRKWNEERETLVKSATHCWIPIEDLREYLNEIPGPELTRMDVAQRLGAFHEERYERYPDEDLKPGCLAVFEREKAEGTELPAIIGAIQEWVEEEEGRRWEERAAANQRRIEEARLALEERLVSGADCKWTPLKKSAEVYCRTNSRTFRLSPRADKMWDLQRINTLEDENGALIGTYRTRGDATKAVATTAYQPEPRW